MRPAVVVDSPSEPSTALFGHLGVEWNLLDGLAEVIALHRRLRRLLHGGDAVRFDLEPEFVAHASTPPTGPKRS